MESERPRELAGNCSIISQRRSCSIPESLPTCDPRAIDSERFAPRAKSASIESQVSSVLVENGLREYFAGNAATSALWRSFATPKARTKSVFNSGIPSGNANSI
ncbi:MAG: hypothetical protein DWI26_03905 [Planctomycetota bacterium]|nr:MAG: hypothetical protein DWI26_03905 [Planctomycetota bacterium]